MDIAKTICLADDQFDFIIGSLYSCVAHSEPYCIHYVLSVTLDLEVYYNGDRAMTEFKIKCYKNNNGKWSYVGIYTPDFLIIKRKEGKIHKAIIVETKGDIYKNEPTFKDKRTFMETYLSAKAP